MRCSPLTLLAILLGLFCTGLSAQTVPAAPSEWGVEQLMQSLGQVKSARGSFVERKYLAILNAPLEFSGTLIYTAPGRLEKRILLPRPETLVLEQDRFTVESPSRNQSRSLALKDYPVVQAFVESIRSTLAGDLQTLTRFYRVALEGNPDKWRLSLVPGEPAMQAVVRQIVIGGSRNRVLGIEVLESQGDRTVTTIVEDPR